MRNSEGGMYLKAKLHIGLGFTLLSWLMISCSTPRHGHEGLRAVLWVQTAAEYRACAEQAYRAAREKLDLAFENQNWTAALEQRQNYQHLPPAVVMDVDRTVLDNSLFQAKLVYEDREFHKDLWAEWVFKGKAAPVPGALEFVKYAESKRVEIFYVTNRGSDHEEGTRKNLERLGFPTKTEPDTVLMKREKGWSSDKSSRRSYIAKDYRILLLIGDDFNDFVSGVKGRGITPEDRIKLADQYRSYWGERWIILPNPIYGSWEGALYDLDYKLSHREKLKREYERLKMLD
jgi:acid phosphatase